MGSSSSKVKVKATDLPPIDHLPNTGTQTHYPPPGFDNAFSGNYYGVLECFYYNQRIDGIQRANNFIQVSRNGHPLEHATATILRCLFDLHHDIKAEPHIITNRNVDEIPRTTLEGSIATVAIGTYHSYGEAVMTGARKSEQGRYKQKYIEKFFNNFLPFLTSIHKACDPVIILGSGSQAVMSDLQVFFHIFYNHYMMDDEIWVNEKNDLMSEPVKRLRAKIGADFTAICQHLRETRRIDLGLLFLKRFGEDTGALELGGPDSELKKQMMGQLMSFTPLIATKHQGAMFRYLAFHTLAKHPFPATVEMPTLSRAFATCGDHSMELETAWWGLNNAMADRGALMQQKRDIMHKAGAPGLQEVHLLTFIMRALIDDLLRTEWKSPEHSHEAFHLLVDYEHIEATRFGESLHSSNGSISAIYIYLAKVLDQSSRLPAINRFVLGLYADNLMKRCPPRYETAVYISDKSCRAQNQWLSSWGIDLDSDDSEAYSRKLMEWVRYVQVAEPNSPTLNEQRAFSTAMIAASWLGRAGRSSPDAERGIRLLQEADMFINVFDTRLYLNEEWLDAVKLCEFRLGLIKHFPYPINPSLEVYEPYKKGVQYCYLANKDPQVEAEALEIMKAATSDLLSAAALKDGYWHPAAVTTIIDTLSPNDLAAKLEAKRRGRELLFKITQDMEKITKTRYADRHWQVVGLPKDFNGTSISG